MCDSYYSSGCHGGRRVVVRSSHCDPCPPPVCHTSYAPRVVYNQPQVVVQQPPRVYVQQPAAPVYVQPPPVYAQPPPPPQVYAAPQVYPQPVQQYAAPPQIHSADGGASLLYEGSVVRLLSASCKGMPNRAGTYGWHLGVDQNGVLVPNCGAGRPSLWRVHTKQGHVLFESLNYNRGNLKIGGNGQVQATGGNGQWAQFAAEVHGQYVGLRNVGNTGKQNRGGSMNWYLGIDPSGSVLPDAAPSYHGLFEIIRA
eukprot:TRINITY_DN15598_c0_g1_i1.p1 TRINITY_DN15598_c0_g1~~TRINITY_DN15598_c0_g1_i1.p1  ORF type:complete len:254 (+),score=22.32 TRINITY_DN15598_c0_g1_i1:65-826(+)